MESNSAERARRTTRDKGCLSRVGRLCPCGSGAKFKRCHGR
ncbi:TPA: SEC-C domain-containing protein [Stenotrophomonas maltophilia]|nr:SEC-C domain-containing protein [Stenotrophomonas maltophilia]HDS1624592.1 SEC-C domain-containing protein [Stenotrophomonas maltophilia]